MPNREASSASSRRAIVISPNSKTVGELEPLLATHLADVQLTQIRSYPSPRDLMGALGGGMHNLVFLDVISDRDQALELMGEMARLGPVVHVIALLSSNDPD